MPFKITCPKCDERISLKTAPEEGDRVKCPECSASFRYEEPEEVEEPEEDEAPARKKSSKKSSVKKKDEGPARKKSSALTSSGGSRRASRDEDEEDQPRQRGKADRDDEDEDEDDRPSRRSKKPAKSGSGLIIALSIGGGVLLLGGVVALVVVLANGGGEVKPPPLAGNPPIDQLAQNPAPGQQPGAGSNQPNTPVGDLVMTAEAITAECKEAGNQKNVPALGQKFASRSLVITGVVNDAHEKDGKLDYLVLSGCAEGHSVLCLINQPPGVQIQKGQRITVKGTCIAVGSRTVTLEKCIITESGSAPTQPAAEQTVTAENLTREYKTNRDQTNQKYRDKSIVVSGVVAKAGQEVGSDKIILLNGCDDAISVSCFFDAVPTQLGQIKKGAPIKVRGKYSRWSDDVVALLSCQVLDLGPVGQPPPDVVAKNDPNQKPVNPDMVTTPPDKGTTPPVGTPDDGKNDAKKIVGTWKRVKMEIDGKEQGDANRYAIQIDDARLKFLTDGRKAGNSPTYRLDPTKNPRQIDVINSLLVGGRKVGPQLGIYRFIDDDTLEICLNQPLGKDSDKRPTAFSTKPGEGSGSILHVLKREMMGSSTVAGPVQDPGPDPKPGPGKDPVLDPKPGPEPAMGPRLTADNLKKIAPLIQARKLTRAQAVEILGPPTQELGPQTIPASRIRSSGALRWTEGKKSFTIYFSGNVAIFGS